VDAPGNVGGFDGEGASRVRDADVGALPGPRLAVFPQGHEWHRAREDAVMETDGYEGSFVATYAVLTENS
jgi:hypothetical protein